MTQNLSLLYWSRVKNWQYLHVLSLHNQDEADWTVDRIVFAFNSSEVPLGSVKSMQNTCSPAVDCVRSTDR